jgi:dipeptidyl aminopeptidase/acylaminoacyl peptidase
MSTAATPSIPLEELARLPSFYLPTVDWSGTRVAYYADHTGRMELYVLELPAGEPRRLSHGEVPRALHAGFVWNRAGTRIVFSKDRDGDEQHDLYAIDTATGTVTRLTGHPGCQEFPVEFSPDDGWLLVATNREGQLNLWRMRPDGSAYTRLTHYASPVRGAAYSHDGRWIAYNTNESADLRNLDGYVMRADGGEPRRVFRVQEGAQDVVADWSPDDRLLAVTSDASGLNRAGVLDLTTGTVRWLTPEGLDESAAGFSRNGRWLVCHRNKDSEVRPVLYEVATGAPRDLKLPPGVAAGSDFVLDDRALLVLYTTDDRRAALLRYRLEDDTFTTLVPAEYGRIDPTVFVTAEHVWYPSGDGLQIPALLYRPREIPAGARLPAIVQVHGGPTAQFLRSFDPFIQFLVNRGYVVLAPNVRGSTGYGRAFRDMNLKDWGGGDLEDIAAGAAYLRALPYVDPARIGITGGSYGGFMTYIATTKRPELWKAAVAWVGITDLRRLYDRSMAHFQYYLRQQMGDPEEYAALWADRSAVNFAANLRAKLLILHGANDPRCPVEQARVFRDALLAAGKSEGVDFEYVEFTDEGHGSTDMEQRLRAYRLMAEFFDRTL